MAETETVVPANRREEFGLILEGLFDENPHVYYDPPESKKMEYPAIRYSLDYIRQTYADNNPYHSRNRYTVTIIDEDQDSYLVPKVASLQRSSFENHYIFDNLHHFAFTVYY